MMRDKLILILVSLALVQASAGCGSRVYTHPADDDTIMPSEILNEAKIYYEDAVKKYDNKRWKTSGEYFNKALELLLSIPDDGLTDIQAKQKSGLMAKISIFQVRLNNVIYGFNPNVDKNDFAMPLVFNSRVEKWLEYYVTNGRKSFSLWLTRSGKYIPFIRAVFKEEGLPPDLAYLALVESGFNPRAYSPARAAGVWQFIKSTGKIYGLESNGWIDERRCPYRSTQAAAQHLKSLYETFGTWELALAAYNCGSERVKKAIQRDGTDDFWGLSLPTETENYVPKLIATLMIVKEPEVYGFTVEVEEELEYEEVVIPYCSDLKVIAKACEVPVEELSILNPELTRLCTPPEKNDYVLKIPKGTKETFMDNFSQLSEEDKYLDKNDISKMEGGWVIHKVRSGETLSHIAKEYNTTVSNIKNWNPSAARKYIYPGQKIKIYRVKHSGSGWVYYKVKSGDTLSGIAKRFNTSVASLKRWNGKAGERYIYPGEIIKISK